MQATAGQPTPATKKRTVTRRGLLIAAINSAIAVPLAGAAGIGYIRGIEPGWVAIERQEFALRGLHPAFAGYRIVQLSDIHADAWMTPERIRDVIQQVNALAPDLIVLTGDYVTDEPVAPYLAGLVPELRQLVARDGVLAVLGNHDNWTNPTAVRAALRDAGVRELRNTSQALTRGEGRLHIAGVDDY
jgi:predicted MPP superfamily phosphohydrolase